MEYENGVLKLSRKLSGLDEKVMELVDLLDREGVDYVIVSGYVAILTGRSRGTEDVDIILEKMDEEEVSSLSEVLEDEGYWCINTGMENLYDFMEDGLSVRIAEEGKAIPNFELFFPQDVYDRSSLENPVKVETGNIELNISPLELQVAYKLYLGSEKDFEDALHLYSLFGERLDTEKLEKLVEELGIKERYDELRET